MDENPQAIPISIDAFYPRLPKKRIKPKSKFARATKTLVPRPQRKSESNGMPVLNRGRNDIPTPIEAHVDKLAIDENGEAASDFLMPIHPVNTVSAKYEMKSKHMAFNAFFSKGNKSMETLKVALSRDSGPKAARFLKALLHPKNANLDIAEIAQQHGITYSDLITIWRNDRLGEAVLTAFDATPKIVEDTAMDAESTQICCPRCDGAGEMKVNRGEEFFWNVCVSCKGTGSIRKAGDRASRQFIFESTGMVSKAGPGVQINNNNNFTVSSVESVLDEMERVIDVTPRHEEQD